MTSTAPVSFTVTAITIQVTPDQGPVATTFATTGAGFTERSTANVSFAGEVLTPVDCTLSFSGTVITTDDSGGFSCTFDVPTVARGHHPVVATDTATSNESNVVSFLVTVLSLSVTPLQGPVGSSFNASGTGFSVDSSATVAFDGTDLTPAACSVGISSGDTITTDSTGAFTCQFAVPDDAAGSHTIVATDITSTGTSNSVSFTLTTPSITVTPGRGPVGASVTVAGIGFSVSTALQSLEFDSKPITGCTSGSLTTDSSGAFSCQFKVPTGTSGTTVTATDVGGKTATGTFVVTVPAITVTPPQGPVGSNVTVAGTGFSVSTALSSLNFDGVAISSCQVGGSLTTSASGAFSCEFRVPSGTTTDTVTATDVGGKSATAAFNVTVPSITVAPTQGSVASTYTVVGSGFTVSSGANVTFGGTLLVPTACSSGTYSGSTITTNSTGGYTCTFRVPSVSSGAYSVNSLDIATSTRTNSISFTVTPLEITVTPSRGPVGAPVTVSGSGFQPSTQVASLVFDGVTVASCTTGSLTTNSEGDWSCGFSVPSDTTGSSVVATNNGGQTATATFTVTTPAITVSPAQGPVGASFVVDGAGFTVSEDATVAFNGIVLTATGCSVGIASGSTITTNPSGAFSCTFTVPNQPAGSYNIVGTDVTTETQTNVVSFMVSTVAISITPGQGPVGAAVTVSGTGFSVSTALASLVFDSVAIESCSSGSLTAGATGTFSCTFKVPGETSGSTVTATDAGGKSASGTFTVTTPVISVTPGQGPVGATVTVSGSGFSVSTALASLDFDGIAVSTCSTGSLVANSAGGFSCTFAVPGGTSGTSVIATDVGGQTASGSFTVTVPAITVTPGQGPVGASVTISGSGFSVSTALASLVFDQVAVSSCSSGDLSTGAAGTFSCSFAVPSGTSGTAVTATDVGGETASGTFTVTTPAISVSPGRGPQGASVSVSGSGFSVSTALASLDFDGVAVLSCSTGSLTASDVGAFDCAFSVPAGTSGTTVRATDVGGESATGSFLVTTPAIVVSPVRGPVGSTAKVTGSGFSVSVALASLVFDNVAITSCASGSLTSNSTGDFSCSFPVPSGTSGTAVTATDASGRVASRTFTVSVPTITMTTGQGPVGAPVTISGSGFSLSSTLQSLIFDSVTVVICLSGSLQTDSSGQFSCSLAVPAGTIGTSVVATDAGGATASARFTVTIPTIAIAPAQGPVGAAFTVNGSGFAVGLNANLTFDGAAIVPSACSIGTLGTTAITTNLSGAFSCTLAVPRMSAGAYNVVGTDLTTSANSTGSFTVTTVTVAVPPGRGPVGATLTVEGLGFSVSMALSSLSFDGKTITSCTSGSMIANAVGGFTCAFAVPAGSAPGTATVTATDAGGQAASASFTVSVPTITVSPAQGPVGAPVTFVGVGFSVSTALRSLVFDGVPISSTPGCSLGTGTSGTFECSTTVPTGTTGSTVTVTDAGGEVATGTFVVTVLAITVSPLQGQAGANFTVSGTGFTVGSNVNVTFDLTVLAPSACSIGTFSATTVTTNLNGTFACTFAVPSLTSGVYGVLATDGATSAKTSAAAFTVTATPVPPPPPSSTSTPFPWWIVAVSVAVVLVLLALAFVYGRRRRHPTRRPPTPVVPAEAPPVAAAAVVPPWSESGLPAAPSSTTAPAPRSSDTGPVAPVAAPTPPEAEPNIDDLIARLDRMSVEIFKRSPKEPSQPPEEEEPSEKSEADGSSETSDSSEGT